MREYFDPSFYLRHFPSLRSIDLFARRFVFAPSSSDVRKSYLPPLTELRLNFRTRITDWLCAVPSLTSLDLSSVIYHSGLIDLGRWLPALRSLSLGFDQEFRFVVPLLSEWAVTMPHLRELSLQSNESDLSVVIDFVRYFSVPHMEGATWWPCLETLHIPSSPLSGSTDLTLPLQLLPTIKQVYFQQNFIDRPSGDQHIVRHCISHPGTFLLPLYVRSVLRSLPSTLSLFFEIPETILTILYPRILIVV
eukprot:TRINITY_DN1810_c0_g1_i5.p1 TRINITY_DN1810_c0_g1~~TRINITY_DN1810_c0_g1_i5.p1  ORF type:complete len:287 (-),score=16.81 TRINITY_DN1810_c0_g1_i5:242-988(-)